MSEKILQYKSFRTSTSEKGTMREIIVGFGPSNLSKGTNYPKNMKDKKKIMLDMKRYGLLHFVTTIEKIGLKLVRFCCLHFG